MPSVNILRDRTSGTNDATRVGHADRDRRRSIVPKSEQGNEAEKSRATSDILCRSRDWHVYRADAAFLHSLFARPKEDEHGELLKLPRSEMTVQGPSVLPLRETSTSLRRALLSYSAIYTVVKVRIMSLRFYRLFASSAQY